jgi:hypothetical protein
MLDKAFLWGADQVCTMADISGLAKGFGLTPGGICIFSGSYWTSAIFWGASAMLALLVMSNLKQK